MKGRPEPGAAGVTDSQYALLSKGRFLPLFIAQALGAFNDNVFKNALVILITYVLAEKLGMNGQLMVTAAAGIFIFPFFIFSALAGQLADKFDKSGLIRRVKLAEVLLMALAGVGFFMESVHLLLVMLFLMGAQSAFFGPLKYGILPDHLGEGELIPGNALIQASTFLAILFGTIVGGLLILGEGGVFRVTLVIVAVAVAGWAASQWIPATRPAAPDLRVRFNVLTETWRVIGHSLRRREIVVALIGISWFWLVGATFLSQVPTFGKQVLGGDESVVTFLLVLFSVGVGIGSLLCNLLLRGEVHATYVPWGAAGITLFSVDLYFASQGAAGGATETLAGLDAFLSAPGGWRVTVDFLLIAVSGGLYIVPLNAIVQARSQASHRARNIAALNILNALFMVASALGTFAMLASGWTVSDVFLAVGLLNAPVVALLTRWGWEAPGPVP